MSTTRETMSDYCTVPEAAAMLGIGRTTMIELLANGKIKYTVPNKQKRVLVSDVLAYRAKKTRKGVATHLPRFENLLAD